MAAKDPEYKPMAFDGLVPVPYVTPEAAQATLAKVAAEAVQALPEWPFDVSAYPAPVMAVLDSLMIWRASWLEWQNSQDVSKADRERNRDLLAAADVADDDLADLADALINWRKAEYPRYARAQARRAADREAMAPKQRPGIERPAAPAGQGKRAKSRGASAD